MGLGLLGAAAYGAGTQLISIGDARQKLQDQQTLDAQHAEIARVANEHAVNFKIGAEEAMRKKSMAEVTADAQANRRGLISSGYDTADLQEGADGVVSATGKRSAATRDDMDAEDQAKWDAAPSNKELLDAQGRLGYVSMDKIVGMDNKAESAAALLDIKSQHIKALEEKYKDDNNFRLRIAEIRALHAAGKGTASNEERLATALVASGKFDNMADALGEVMGYKTTGKTKDPVSSFKDYLTLVQGSRDGSKLPLAEQEVLATQMLARQQGAADAPKASAKPAASPAAKAAPKYAEGTKLNGPGGTYTVKNGTPVKD